jgi:hypothetical protein
MPLSPDDLAADAARTIALQMLQEQGRRAVLEGAARVDATPGPPASGGAITDSWLHGPVLSDRSAPGDLPLPQPPSQIPATPTA